MAFSYYKSLTLDHTQAGSANSTDWPLTIALDGNVQSADADLKTVGNGGYVQNSNGYDIRPYSDSALTSAMTYELVYYDASTGKLEMHVKIPTLSVSSDTVIYLAFGDSSISTDGSSNTTWSTYTNVWHFKDGSSLNLNDSTSNANNLTNSSAIAATGQIDGAISTNSGAGFATSSSATGFNGNMSASFWVKGTGANTAFAGIIGDYDAAGGTGGWTVRLDGNGYLSWSAGGSGGFELSTFSPNITNADDTNWHYAAISVNGTTLTPFYDGTTKNNNTLTITRATSPYNFAVGSSFSAGVQWKGVIDEVRIYNSTRSMDWFTADYNAQKTSSTFITWGAKTALGIPNKSRLFLQAVNRASIY